MKVRIEIDCSDDALAANQPGVSHRALAGVLRNLANDIEGVEAELLTGQWTATIMDANGNTIGKATFTED